MTASALELLDSHRYIYLTEISEPRDNVLRLQIEEGRVPSRRQGSDGLVGRPIVADDHCAAYEVLFADYVAYGVVNESFERSRSDDQFTGRIVRIYTRSAFLAFIASGTTASVEHPGPFTHYEFCCLNHIVSVAAISPPQVRVLRVSRTALRQI